MREERLDKLYEFASTKPEYQKDDVTIAQYLELVDEFLIYHPAKDEYVNVEFTNTPEGESFMIDGTEYEHESFSAYISVELVNKS